jgi:DNA end-binding protein Ku
MARAVWTGAISFGLVNVPVRAYTAVRDHDVHFHQLQRRTGARIRYKKVSDTSGREVDNDDIELGYEVGPGRYVTVDPDELETFRPRTTKTIDVTDFVPLDEIDPIYYERTYWLAPADDTANAPYQLLLAAMENQQRVGIGTVVMRRKQYLAAIRPLDKVLAMSTMRFADEVVPKSQVDRLPTKRTKVDRKQLALAEDIVDALAASWDPKQYKDTYTDDVRDLIKRREKGEEIVVEEAPAESAQVIDLMAALEASVSAAKGGSRATRRRKLDRAARELARESENGDEGKDAGDRKRARSSSKKRTTKKAAARKRSRKSA